MSWTPVNDWQSPNWNGINDGQTPSWSGVNDGQSPNWNGINDGQTPSWSGVIIELLLQQSGSPLLQQNGYFIGLQDNTPTPAPWVEIVT